jgi:ERCC4-type nuclease
MQLLVDTREQKPLEFNHPYITEVIRVKQTVGDYGCRFSDGTEPPIKIERKSLPDLFNSLSNDYKRFKKEILRSKENKVTLIVAVEASLTKVLKGIETSSRCGDEILQQMFTLYIRYNLYFVFCNNRDEMARWVTELFLALGREHIKNKADKKLCG